MRLLHVLDHSIPLHSGYTFRTLSILREQRRLGWETFHITGAKQIGCTASEEDVDGWHFYRTPPQPSALAQLPGAEPWLQMGLLERRLQQVVRQARPDILHAHSPVLNALPALKVGRQLGIPVVYEVRAFWEDAAVDHGTTTEGSLRYRLTRAMETRALRRAAHVFTICEGLRGDIVARGIPASKVTVIPNAVDIDAFEPGGKPHETLKAQLGLAGCTVLGFIGSFYAYEGLDLLLEALPAILGQQPGVRVLLVGGGPQDAALKAQALRLGLQDKVVFTGRVPHAEVGRYYDLVDVLAYPRHSMRLTELVTPLKPLEAMAQGRIFVASDVGGHKELVRDGETGVLFAAGRADALAGAVLGLLANRDSWPRLRAQGRSFVETERNWRASVARYAAVYQRLAAGVRQEEAAGMTVADFRGLCIALVGPLPPPAGGMANQTRQLAELLRGEGARVELVQTNAAYRPAWVARLPVLRALLRLVPYLLALWRAAGRNQLLHVMANSGWSWHLFAAPAIWIAALRGRPVLVNYRGGEAGAFLQESAPVVKASLRRASVLAVPSGFLREVFSSHGLQAEILPNVVDLRRFRPDDEAAPAPLAAQPPHLLVARNLEPLYDNATAIRAFAEVRRHRPDACMTVAGTGPEAPALRALAVALGVADAVHFAGRVERDGMAALYRRSRLSINPSLADNMPNSVLESLASGVPVVSTHVGGVPYLVQDGVTALLVPPRDVAAMRDAILRLLADAALHEQLRHNGLAEVQRYTWAQVSPVLAALYARCLRATAPAAVAASRP